MNGYKELVESIVAMHTANSSTLSQRATQGFAPVSLGIGIQRGVLTRYLSANDLLPLTEAEIQEEIDGTIAALDMLNRMIHRDPAGGCLAPLDRRTNILRQEKPTMARAPYVLYYSGLCPEVGRMEFRGDIPMIPVTETEILWTYDDSRPVEFSACKYFAPYSLKEDKRLSILKSGLDETSFRRVSTRFSEAEWTNLLFCAREEVYRIASENALAELREAI